MRNGREKTAVVEDEQVIEMTNRRTALCFPSDYAKVKSDQGTSQRGLGANLKIGLDFTRFGLGRKTGRIVRETGLQCCKHDAFRAAAAGWMSDTDGGAAGTASGFQFPFSTRTPVKTSLSLCSQRFDVLRG